MDVGIISGLIVLSALFSGSETAMLASSRAKLHNLEKSGNRAAMRVTSIINNPETMLATILLGNNLVNILASALAASAFMGAFGEAGIVYATGVMTVVVLVFAEVLPKTIAARYPERVAMIMSMPLLLTIKTLRPFTWAIKAVISFILRMFGMTAENADPNFGEEDLRGAIGLSLSYGVLKKPEHRMLDSILELDQLTVEDVMTHRSAIVSLDLNLPAENLYQAVASSAHSRIPLWEDNPDNIVGVLHAKDFYRAWEESRRNGKAFNVRDVMQEPYFVPEQAVLSEQMLIFRKQRKHMGLVVDEYGDIMGLVTLEDILEEIVGEIEDEHDEVHAWYTRQADGSVTVSGAFAVRDANRDFDWELPDDDAVSLGGLIVDEAQRIPSVGEKITVGNIEFEILARRRQSISRLQARVIKNPQKNDEQHDHKDNS